MLGTKIQNNIHDESQHEHNTTCDEEMWKVASDEIDATYFNFDLIYRLTFSFFTYNIGENFLVFLWKICPLRMFYCFSIFIVGRAWSCDFSAYSSQRRIIILDFQYFLWILLGFLNVYAIMDPQGRKTRVFYSLKPFKVDSSGNVVSYTFAVANDYLMQRKLRNKPTKKEEEINAIDVYWAYFSLTLTAFVL